MAAHSTIKDVAGKYKRLSEVEKSYITGVMMGMILERESKEKGIGKTMCQKGA